MDKKIILAIVLIIFLGLIIGLYLFWQQQPFQLKLGSQKQKTENVLPSVITNPIESKPDINPADKANPFKEIKLNPFE